MKAVKLSKKEVPAGMLKAFPKYTGRKFSAEAATKVYLSDTYWSGGSKNTYVGIDLHTMNMAPANKRLSAPSMFGGLGDDIESIPLAPGRAIVEHCIFQGKDMGLRFFFHPEDFGKYFPMIAGV